MFTGIPDYLLSTVQREFLKVKYKIEEEICTSESLRVSDIDT